MILMDPEFRQLKTVDNVKEVFEYYVEYGYKPSRVKVYSPMWRDDNGMFPIFMDFGVNEDPIFVGYLNELPNPRFYEAPSDFFKINLEY